MLEDVLLTEEKKKERARIRPRRTIKLSVYVSEFVSAVSNWTGGYCFQFTQRLLMADDCVHLIYNSSWKFSWVAPVWAPGTILKRQAVQNHTCRVTLLGPAVLQGGPSC